MSGTNQDGSQSSTPLGGRDDAELLAKILETSLVGITVVDAEGQITFANPKAEEILGLAESEITSRVYNDPKWRITTLDGGQFPDEELPFQRVRDTGKAVEHVRHNIVWTDGRTVSLSINASPLTDANGGFAGIVAGIEDISAAVESEWALERQNRANRVLTQCNEALIQASDETSLLEEVCRIVVEVGGYRFAWVGYAEGDGSKIMKPIAQFGFEEGYLDAIFITWDETDTGRGPAGTAIRTGQPAGARNILSDPAFSPWRDEALKRGYASSLVLPLTINSHTLAALSIYAAEPDAFDFEEKRLLMQMAGDLAYGITTLRAREGRTRIFAELKESREDWQRIFNSISDLVIILDLEQNILAANPATEKKLELPQDRILGRKCYELFHLLDEAAEGCPFKSLVESGGAVAIKETEMEMVIGNVSGTFLVSVAPIFDAEGKLSRVLHIAKDITDRKRAEEELKLTEEKYRSLAENSPDLIARFDRQFRHLYVNPAAAKAGGYSPEEYIGKTKREVDISEQVAQKWEERISTVFETGQIVDVEDTFGTLEGEKNFNTKLVPERATDGTIQSVQSVARDITGRMQAEESLRESEHKFRTIVDSAIDGILIVNISERKFVEANRSICKMLGYDREELITLGIDDIHPKADVPRVVEEFEKQIRGEKTIAANLPVLRKDGSIFYADIATAAMMLGGQTHAVGIFHDITERKRVENALRENQARLDLALQSASMGVWHWDIIENKRYFDDQTCHLLGIKPATFTGTAEEFFAVVHPDDREKNKEALARTIEQDVLYEPEYRAIWPDGSMHYIVSRGRLVRDDKGSPLGINGIIWDITERKLVEEAMRDSEEKYRTLFEQSKDGIVIGPPEGKIKDSNSAIAEMLGYSSRKELLELDSANELYERPEDRDALIQIMRQQGFVKNYEVNMKRRDGSPIVVSMSATASRDEKGKVVSARSIIRDMTTHRLMEQQLIESQKLESIGRLAGGVAHDFNNFLTVIQGYIDLAGMETSVGDEAREDLAEARAASERAANLARQLLLFSRREPVEMKPVNLNDIVGNLLKMLGRLIGEQYSIKLDLAEDLQNINGDPGHLEQVLMNLVVNARDATPEGGTVTLRARNVSIDPKVVKTKIGKSKSQFVELSVTDTGKGMDAEMVKHIFEPFFSTKGAAVGTGLGLSVVYGIITQHGGWIDVDSAPGRGSTFSIYFPAIEKAATAGQTEMRSEGMTRGHGERILLVEDEDYLRKMVEKIMTESGYEVVAAATAEEAERTFIREKGKFDLIFSDVILPGKDGVWLVERLREHKYDLPILMASGYSDIPVTQAISKMGYTMMQKPYDISELMRVISSLMKSPPTKV